MPSIWVLAGTAATIGFIHTLIGPDHYLPFIVLSRARKWRLSKTLLLSFLCGLGHVLSSVVLGFIGIGLGLTVGHLEKAEATRGNLASWLLIGFGLAYAVWGLRRGLRSKEHEHPHVHLPEAMNFHSPQKIQAHADNLSPLHSPGQIHSHPHIHEAEHLHPHEEEEKKNITAWVLFIIFVFGPCEPLIPLVMFPAAQHSIKGVILVTLAFGTSTILTMLTLIALSSWGLSFLALGRFERYSHALAGAIIFLSGLSVNLLGL